MKDDCSWFVIMVIGFNDRLDVLDLGTRVGMYFCILSGFGNSVKV